MFRAHRDELRPLRPQESKVVDSIVACRTATLGGHLYECPSCGHAVPVYNACLDRHCPKCHRQKQAEWVDAREKELLPIPYFHVVFTIPKELHALFLASRKVAYGLLFSAAAETLVELAEARLEARIGFLAVLHTWTQTLLYHPHVHCIVTGGGLSFDGKRWIACRPNFFLAVRALADLFRGKLLNRLERAIETKKLEFEPEHAARCLRRAARKRWVVHSKAPFAGPEVFLKYISRYVHRVAIDDRRLVAYDGRNVTFSYRDRHRGDVVRHMTLRAPVLLGRFLLHLLPKGFVKIRNYGLLANGVKQKNLARCRELLGPVQPAPPAPAPETDAASDSDQPQGRVCPICSARLICSATLPPDPSAKTRPP